MNISALEKYKTATVKTSDTSGQMLFVFDEIIKLLYIAKKALEEKNYELKHKTLVKIIDVIMILRSGINTEVDPLLASLDKFYELTVKTLHQVNIKSKEPEEFDILVDSIKQVRDSLREAQTGE